MGNKFRLPPWFILLGKGLIVVSTFYLLYEAILTENTQPETWILSLISILRKGEGQAIVWAALLILINWGLEARKWQYLAAKVEKISYWSACKAVLAGMSLGFITPNRVGDYAGRIMALRSRQRLEGLGAIFLGRFCQLTITVAVGSVAVLYFLAQYNQIHVPVLVSMAFSLVLVNGLLAMLLFQPQIMVAAVLVVPALKKYIRYLSVITAYSASEIFRLLLLSFWRYLVFVGQFMLLLYAFGVQVSWWQMALGVSGTFLLKSVVPSLSALSDLGMRELSAIYFFNLMGQSKLQVMSASLSLWFLNIALPSLTGLAFVASAKWQLKKDKKVKF